MTYVLKRILAGAAIIGTIVLCMMAGSFIMDLPNARLYFWCTVGGVLVLAMCYVVGGIVFPYRKEIDSDDWG